MKRTFIFIFGWVTLTLGQVCTWEPLQPVPGGVVEIFYDAVAGSLPDGANPVNIHIGQNGWLEIVDEEMTDEGGGLWSYIHDIPENATILDFVFFDNNGNWDNNGGEGIDFHIAVNEIPLWSPPAPGPNDTIRISVAYPSPGYLWWGVNSWTAPIETYQPEGTLIGEEGLSVDSPLNGPGEDGYSWVEIGPFNRPSQAVETVDFVFHFDDGEWDNNDGSDYHIPLNYIPGPDDPTIDILNIADGATLVDDQLVEVSTENSIYNEIRLDGQTRHITSDADFSFTLSTSSLSYGRHQLAAFARRDNNRVMMDIKEVWKTPDITYASFPPFDYLGVHDRQDGTLTFALLAPAKRFVSLIGSFNDWDPEANLMSFDTVEGIWWTNIALDEGTHQYMYLVDGEKQVGDPFATDLSWTDMYGNESGSAVNQKCIVQVPGASYDWDDFTKPDMNDLIIYEMLIRDFTDEGTIAAATERLDYLADLGITAIQLMPPTEFPGASSWGYNPAFFMAFESSYGTPAELRDFVNQAHLRGMAVLIDLVFNHADGSSAMYQLYGNDYENSPYFHEEGNAWGFPDFDHGRAGTRALVSRTVRHWIRNYNIDGYRYDHTPGIGWSGLYDFGISYFSYEAWLENNETYQIAEHFDSDIWNLISMTKIQSHWHDAFHDQMKANLRRGSFEGSWWGDMNKTERGLSYAADGFNDAEACVNYLESHDEQRVIWEAQTNGLTYTQALQQAKLGAAALFTSAGIPMFYMGSELAMDTERTLDYNRLRWHYLEDPDRAEIHELYRRLMWLRNNYTALRADHFHTVYKNNSQKVIVYHRQADDAPAVVVALNFNSSDQVIDIQFPWNGTWYEFMEDDTIAIETEWYGSYTLPANSARIFTNERTWLAIDDSPDIPLSFQVYPAYPNPFNPVTTIRFDLESGAATELVIYDLAGREVWRQSVAGTTEPGQYQVRWDGLNSSGHLVPAGVYLAEIRSGAEHGIQKLMLLK